MATDYMRPHTAQGYNGEPVDYMDTETKVAQDFALAPGFRKHLEHFYEKATPEDQARCLELLTSLNIGDTVKQEVTKDVVRKHQDFTGQYQPRPPPPRRPKSAFAALDYTRDTNMGPPGPYTTTYMNTYSAYPGEAGVADRPNTTKRAFQSAYSLKGKIGDTTYQHEYYDKPQKKTPHIRTGSASGNRRNNPHPPEGFMVWKLPHKIHGEKSYSEWSTELTDEMMDNVCRGQLMSTYQQDYLGIPQGFQPKSPYDNVEDWRSRVPYTRDSYQRHVYQHPNPQPELKGNTVRYGCNKLKNTPAVGAVPTVSSRMPQMNIKTRTTYEREYNDACSNRPQEVRDISHQLNTEALHRHYEAARAADDAAEQQKLTRMMNAMSVKPANRPPSNAAIRQSHKFTPKHTYVA